MEIRNYIDDYIKGSISINEIALKEKTTSYFIKKELKSVSVYEKRKSIVANDNSRLISYLKAGIVDLDYLMAECPFVLHNYEQSRKYIHVIVKDNKIKNCRLMTKKTVERSMFDKMIKNYISSGKNPYIELKNEFSRQKIYRSIKRIKSEN